MTNYTPGHDRPIPKNLLEVAHEETGQWFTRDELENWVFRRFQRFEQRIKMQEGELESKLMQNLQLMRDRDDWQRMSEQYKREAYAALERETALTAQVETLKLQIDENIEHLINAQSAHIERDELAAHVERIISEWNEGDDQFSDEWINRMGDITEDSPATSLARLKLIAQAELLERLASGSAQAWDYIEMTRLAIDLRQQAEALQ